MELRDMVRNSISLPMPLGPPSIPTWQLALSHGCFCGRHKWATTTAPNKNVKVFIGAPASPHAGSHYVTAGQMGEIIKGTRSYSSFGGVMLWDAYWAKGARARARADSLDLSGGEPEMELTHLCRREQQLRAADQERLRRRRWEDRGGGCCCRRSGIRRNSHCQHRRQSIGWV